MIWITFVLFTLVAKSLFRHLRTKRESRNKIHAVINTNIMCWSLCVKQNFSYSVHPAFFPSFFLFYSVCQAGQWQCSTERCAAQCSIIGAMKITTFDKKRYNLQAGDCQLTAIEVRCHNQCWYNHFYHIFMASSLPFCGIYTAHLSGEMQYQRLG